MFIHPTDAIGEQVYIWLPCTEIMNIQRQKKEKKKEACVIHALLNNVTKTQFYSLEDTLNKNILYILKWNWKVRRNFA